MKKLFALKKWLTVPEAARHLTLMLGEEVCEADVLRLALDGHLTLSVSFLNEVRARKGKVIPLENAKYIPLSSLLPEGITDDCPEEVSHIRILSGLQIDAKRVLKLEKQIVTLHGVNDLAMIGDDRRDVECRYQRLTNGPRVTSAKVNGTFVCGDSNVVYQLLESFEDHDGIKGTIAHWLKLHAQVREGGPDASSAKVALEKHDEERIQFLEWQEKNRSVGKDFENYCTILGFPEESILVVRTEALREFEHSINAETTPVDKPITTTERNTLLTIIAGLCDYSDIDPKARGAAVQIAGFTAEIGAPVTDDTVRMVLAKIPNAVERRMK